MFKKVFKYLFLLCCVPILFFKCDVKRDSFGDFEKIVVFADSTIYKDIEFDLQQIFDQFIYTPHSERSFFLELQPLQRLAGFRMSRNIMYIGLTDAEDFVSEYVSKMISPEIKQAVRENKIFHIFQENLYANEQLGIFLLASDIKRLKQNIAAYGEDLLKDFEASYFKRLELVMFDKAEQTAMEDYLAENLGWKIRIQYDYILTEQSEDGNFVWFRRLRPDRNIFIYRFKADSLRKTSEWLINLRDSLTTIYFESDSISNDDTYLKYINFNNLEAIKLVGVWQNHKLLIGGPFRTYAFYNEGDQYIYMIDISVTAPGKRKKPYLDQLEVMANSFRFISSGGKTS